MAALLTPAIKADYERAINRRDKTVLLASAKNERDGCSVDATLFQTTAEAFLQTPELGDEIFGPTTLLVISGTRDRLLDIARSMEGQLTAAIFGNPDDLRNFSI